MSSTYTAKEIDLRQWHKKDRDVKVDFVSVSGVKMPKDFVNDNGDRLVHWRFGCAYTIDTEERSTSYDTQKLREDDPVVQIQLISKDFHTSSVAAATLKFKCAKKFTTTDVYEFIMKNGYWRYAYDGNGSGCLFWTSTIIAQLEAQGFIKQGATKELKKIVAETRSTSGLWVPDDKGVFFE